MKMRRSLLLRQITFAYLLFFYGEIGVNLKTYAGILQQSQLILGIFVTLTLVSLSLSIFTRGRLFPAISLLMTVILSEAITPLRTGQDVLIFNLHFFAVLLPGGKENQDQFSPGGYLFLIGELIVIYFANGLAKLNAPDWVSGRAAGMFLGSNYLDGPMGISLSWMVILIQLSVPLILVQKIRIPIASLCIMLHLVILFKIDFHFGVTGILIQLYVINFRGSVTEEWTKILSLIQNGHVTIK